MFKRLQSACRDIGIASCMLLVFSDYNKASFWKQEVKRKEAEYWIGELKSKLLLNCTKV
jgi:hypothetical protein